MPAELMTERIRENSGFSGLEPGLSTPDGESATCQDD